MKHTFTLAAVALAVSVLSGCSGGGVDVASVPSAPSVSINTQFTSNPLTDAQSQQVTAALAKLTADNAADVLSELAGLQGSVGFNTTLSQAVGVATLVQAGLNASAATALVKNTGAVSAISQLVSFGVGDDGKPSAAFESSLAVGSTALDALVPPGFLVADLTASQKSEVGVASTVQSLRVISAILGTGSLGGGQTGAEANTAITSNFTAERKAQLEAAAALLVETTAPAKAALSDGSATNNATIDTFTTSMTAAMADREITAAELQGIVAGMRSKLGG